MKVMVIVKANPDSEAGALPSTQLLTEMGEFNEQLVGAGVMLAGEGLHPTARGAQVRFSGSGSTVVAGPFVPAEDQIAGFWLWQVKSLDQAIEWAKRIPNPGGRPAVYELRPAFEAEDFGPNLTPELKEQEARLRARSAEQD